MSHVHGSLNHTMRPSQLRMRHMFLKAPSESMEMERHAMFLQQKQVSWHDGLPQPLKFPSPALSILLTGKKSCRESCR